MDPDAAAAGGKMKPEVNFGPSVVVLVVRLLKSFQLRAIWRRHGDGVPDQTPPTSV